MSKPLPLNCSPATIIRRAAFRIRMVAIAGAAVVLMFSLQASRAGSATWNINPDTGDWNNADHWSAGGPPNGPLDTATFFISLQTSIFLSADTEVNAIVFSAGASAYSVSASPAFTLMISGAGIINNSGITQNFVASADATGNAGLIEFINSATAGSQTTFTSGLYHLKRE